MYLKKDKLLNIAKEYDTPLYVYNGDLVKKRYKELYDFIDWPILKIHYALKANYNPAILGLLKEEGAYLDTVSPGEVELALELGFSKDKILYTANNLTEEEMQEVAGKGVLMNIGSLSRLEKYGKAYPNTEVCIRFNPDVKAGAFEATQTAGDLTKFGILMKDVDKVKEIVEKYDLTVVGLHEHTGSGIAEKEKVYKSMKNLLKVAKKEDFPDLKFIDFGGGFKVPYEPDEKRIDYREFGEKITEIFSEFCEKYGKDLEMRFEPGKYIVAESGYLLITVNTLKNNNGRLIVGTDSGFPQLIRPFLYGAYHHIVNLSNPKGEKKKYDICGNICETGDRFAEQRKIPKIREGDVLAIENAGAYCYAMGGIYNFRPMPSEVLVEDGEDKLVRKQLTNKELVKKVLGEYE